MCHIHGGPHGFAPLEPRGPPPPRFPHSPQALTSACWLPHPGSLPECCLLLLPWIAQSALSVHPSEPQNCHVQGGAQHPSLKRLATVWASGLGLRAASCENPSSRAPFSSSPHPLALSPRGLPSTAEPPLPQAPSSSSTPLPLPCCPEHTLSHLLHLLGAGPKPHNLSWLSCWQLSFVSPCRVHTSAIVSSHPHSACWGPGAMGRDHAPPPTWGAQGPGQPHYRSCSQKGPAAPPRPLRRPVPWWPGKDRTQTGALSFWLPCPPPPRPRLGPAFWVAASPLRQLRPFSTSASAFRGSKH